MPPRYGDGHIAQTSGRVRSDVSLDLLQVRGGVLAAAAVGLDVEADLLALDEAAQAGALERGRMDEHVLAAVVRLR